MDCMSLHVDCAECMHFYVQLNQLIGFVRSGLFGIFAFSRAIEPTDRVCKHSFACGLCRMCAFSHAIEPIVGFVSTALHVDCAECVHFHNM